LNIVFLALVAIAFLTTAWRQVAAPPAAAGTPLPMEALGTAMLEAAGSAVTLALGLIGVMALFLGLMKVAEAGGLLAIVAKLVRPLMQRLFPTVPPDHPAMGAMILNISASTLGLGNAATPFGIRAMQELDRINPMPGTASDAMALFLAINTSSVTLLPTAVIALRAAAGSTDPAAIVPTTLFASLIGTAVAIVAAKMLQRSWPPAAADSDVDPAAAPTCAAQVPAPDDVTGPASPLSPVASAEGSYPLWVSLLVLAGIAALVPLTVVYGQAVATWLIPMLTVALLGFGALRGVAVYEAFVEGARDGFQVAVRIIPYLLAILVAVAMLRASGALTALTEALGPLTGPVGLPAEALPMALLRPFSGSAGYGILAALLNDPAIGPDSYTGLLVSTIQGSTETTFYVLAVYFGAVGVRRVRYTVVAALAADAVSVGASVVICSLLYGA
jgi:spore maturation protein SpmA/spore maturation protein SpmB